MAWIDLDRFFIIESEVGIEIDVVIEDVFRDALCAKRNEVGDSTLKFIDLSFLDPKRELFIDRSRPFLEDERCVIEV